MLRRLISLALISLYADAQSPSPIIGGLCNVGTADVDIGGQSTQLYLSCEERKGLEGKIYGVWVVRSRLGASIGTRRQPDCVVLSQVRERGACDHEAASDANCLQPNDDDSSSTYLQCTPENEWLKRPCGENLRFSFQHQACIGHASGFDSNVSRQYISSVDGVQRVCTFYQCSSANPCSSSQSACESGYCCTPTPVVSPSSGCPASQRCPDNPTRCCGEQQRICSDGSQALSAPPYCTDDNQCPSGYNCPRNVGGCCRLSVRNCPDKTPSQPGICLSDGQCSVGYYCEASMSACCRSSLPAPLPAPIPAPVALPSSSSCQVPCRSNTACPQGWSCAGSSCCQRTVIQSCPVGPLLPVNCLTDRSCPRGWYCMPAANFCCRGAKLTSQSEAGNGASRDKPFPLARHANSLPCRVRRCLSGALCCSNGRDCCTSSPSRVCPSGAPASDVRCATDADCGGRMYCATSLRRCCLSPTPPALPSRPLRCSTYNTCPVGYTCCSTSTCCRIRTCPGHTYPLAQSCNRGCPVGSFCYNGNCCPSLDRRCADGSVPLHTPSTCSTNSPCPSNTYCNGRGVCCRLVGGAARSCSDGSASLRSPAVCSATLNRCPTGFFCDVGAVCCPSAGVPRSRAPTTPRFPSARPASGVCPDGSSATTVPPRCSADADCPAGFSCSGMSVCCFDRRTPVAVTTPATGASCADGVASLPQRCSPAAATGGFSLISCPSGYRCMPSINVCCRLTPRTCPLGEEAATVPRTCTPGSTAQCPASHYCTVSGVCCATPNLVCPSGKLPSGRCLNGFCGVGFSCVQPAKICCEIITTTLRCPNGDQAVGACINGQCGVGFTCSQSSNLCCPIISTTTFLPPTPTTPTAPTPSPFNCPDGTQAAGACINGLCGSGFVCQNNLCCSGSVTTVPPARCLDGALPVGSCLGGLCPVGSVCTTGNLCCPTSAMTTTAAPPAVCAGGTTPIGACVGGLCGAGFVCTASNVCCPDTTVPNQCPDGQAAAGSCVNGQCGGGLTCQNNLCCPPPVAVSCPNNQTPLGPCVSGLCGTGFVCINSLCCPATATPPPTPTCPAGTTQVGACISGVACPAGSSCVSGLCCSPANILNHCSDGRPGVGACIMGLCGVGFTCESPSNLCCPTVVGAAAASTSRNAGTNNACLDGSLAFGSCPTGANTCPSGYVCHNRQCCRSLTGVEVLSPGSPCQGAAPQVCVGYRSGLATCVNEQCRCQPVAYQFGSACVRRQSLHLKLLDAVVDESDSPANGTHGR